MTVKSPLYTVCLRCRARVLEVRWDWQDNILIGTPLLDPVGLDYQQTTACILTGIPLWQMHRRLSGTWATSRRTRWWPTTPVPGVIAPEHACGRVWDAFPLDLAPENHTLTTTCPF